MSHRLVLDTNVLVRYLTQDDPIQSPKAADLIERALTESEPGYISIVAMVETTWVLERTYEFSATDIAVAIERMLQAPVLTVESEQEVFTAMIAMKERRANPALNPPLMGRAIAFPSSC